MSDHENRGTPVVTGSSTGIGAVYAEIARRGYDLVFVARINEKLHAIAKRLTTSTGRSIEVASRRPQPTLPL